MRLLCVLLSHRWERGEIRPLVALTPIRCGRCGKASSLTAEFGR